jgi:hypothetical protein
VTNLSELAQTIDYQLKSFVVEADLSHKCHNKLVEKKSDTRKFFLCRNRF